MSIFNRIFSYINKYKKQGFTLAEALIITIMTGYCLLPILGTMQNAQKKAESFDHHSRMEQYARSRLTNEIANSAFDHNSIDLTDEYHYLVYFDAGKDGEDPCAENAHLKELPKTTIGIDDILALENKQKDINNWTVEECNLFGIDPDSTTAKTPYFELAHAYKTTVEIKDNP